MMGITCHKYTSTIPHIFDSGCGTNILNSFLNSFFMISIKKIRDYRTKWRHRQPFDLITYWMSYCLVGVILTSFLFLRPNYLTIWIEKRAACCAIHENCPSGFCKGQNVLTDVIPHCHLTHTIYKSYFFDYQKLTT